MTQLMKRIATLILAAILVVSAFGSINASAKPANNVDYSAVFDATYYSNAYPDLKAAFGTDASKLLNHFVSYGMAEGRQGCADFNVIAYKNRYADLQAAFGDDLTKYYIHYITAGKSEGRNGKAATATTTATPVATADVPADAIKYNGGYIPTSVGPATVAWINSERSKAKVKNITWSDTITRGARERSVELSMTFNSGRPDGSQWTTAYTKDCGEVKEMLLKFNGVASDETIIKAIAGNTDKMKYIVTEKFEKSGISVYVKDGVSYVIVAFSFTPEEKK